jgi:nicotinamide-nucleotide amidase
MNATILCVGTELLFGQIVNTNAAYLSEKLQMMGINVLYHYTVGDNPDRMRSTLKRAFEDTDLVITSGGLGPTQDDLTKEIITEILGDELIKDERQMRELEEMFSRWGRVMTENNKKQAWVPSRATVFYNTAGTAPGFALESGGHICIALPGPPRELKHLFETWAVPYLEKLTDAVISHKMLRFYGIGESQLETDLLPLIDGQTDPTIATYAKEGECSLRIASRRLTKEEADLAVNEMEDKVKAIAGKYLYSDADEDLYEVAARRLIASGLTLASAESCTGGLFAGQIISVPGISAVFDRGFVTYSNSSKTELLGVPADIIDTYGAVSEEVAVFMAKGARERAHTDIGISVTGVAGPDGGTEEKPIGLAWIACAYGDGEVRVSRHFFRDRGRDWNRKSYVLNMFSVLNKVLQVKK